MELKPGGFHLMFMDLMTAPKPDETVKATLTFAKAGKVEIDVPVHASTSTTPQTPTGAGTGSANGHHKH